MEEHKHTGIDSPKISARHIDGLIGHDDVMNTSGAETVADIKTFSSIPVLPASNPTTDNQASRKRYIDDNVPDYSATPSPTLIDSADTEREVNIAQTTYGKDKDITLNEEGGTITVEFDLKDDNGGGGLFGLIYVSGAPVGTERECGTTSWVTYSEQIELAKDDEVQLYTKYDSGGGGIGGNTRNFRLYYNKSLTHTPGTINLN